MEIEWAQLIKRTNRRRLQKGLILYFQAINLRGRCVLFMMVWFETQVLLLWEYMFL